MRTAIEIRGGEIEKVFGNSSLSRVSHRIRSINETIREAEQGLGFLSRIKSSKMPPKTRRGASLAASKAPKTTAKKGQKKPQLDIVEKRKEHEATNACSRAESVARSVGNASTGRVFIIPESLLRSLLSLGKARLSRGLVPCTSGATLVAWEDRSARLIPANVLRLLLLSNVFNILYGL